MHETYTSLLADIPYITTEEQRERLARYVAFVEEANTRVNITGAKTQDVFFRKHVLDSLAAASFFEKATYVIDVGSGAGIPGIPLAIAFPTVSVTLCESKMKKARVLREFVTTLGLKNCEVSEKNVFEVRKRFDTITMKAFCDLEKAVKVLQAVGTKHARLIAYKGKHAVIEKELEKIDNLLYTVIVRRVVVPSLDEERHIVAIERKRPQGDL